MGPRDQQLNNAALTFTKTGLASVPQVDWAEEDSKSGKQLTAKVEMPETVPYKLAERIVVRKSL